MPQIEPMTIDVPLHVLDDLRERLERTRWPDEVPELAGVVVSTWII